MSATPYSSRRWAICTAMLSSAAWPGSTGLRGASDRQFLELARRDVPLRAVDDARTGRGRRSQLYVEMLEAGFGRRRRISLPAPRPRRTTLRQHLRDGRAHPARRAETGIGLTLLPVFYAHSGFGGAAPNEGQRRFVNDRRELRACSIKLRAACSESRRHAAVGLAPHSLRAVTRRRAHCHRRDRRRRADPHPHRRADEGGQRLRRLVRRAAGRMAARQTRRSTGAGA